MNKKITPKIFFSVLGSGIKNALLWIFGYKYKSGFWRVIVALITLSLVAFVGMMVYAFGCEVHWWSKRSGYDRVLQLNQNISYKYRYNYYDENVGNIIDMRGRKLVKDVNWISENEDSIIVYAQNGYRGYFDLQSAKVLVPANKYTRAYVYREGRALALNKDSLFVLDLDGKVVKGFSKGDGYNTSKYCYHHGHLPMVGENGKMGLIGTDGEWIVNPEYDAINYYEPFWLAHHEAVMADGDYVAAEPAKAMILDDSLRLVLSGEWTAVKVLDEDGFIVTDQNHWQRRYGYDGKLKDDFLCDRIETMSYQTGETGFRTRYTMRDGEESAFSEEYPIEAMASLKKYVTVEGWEGLMTADGRVVTPPLYWHIQAVGRNLYLCHNDQTCNYAVLVNEKGEIVTTSVVGM